MAMDGDDRNDAGEALVAVLNRLAEGARALATAAEPTLQRLDVQVQRFREAAEPKLQQRIREANRVVTALQPSLDRAQELLDDARAWTSEHGPAVAEVLVGVQYFAAHAHVENWDELDFDEMETAMQLMRADDGVPLAWVPPSHIVKALVDADDHDARDAVLLAHSDEVIAASRDILKEVTLDRLQDASVMIDESWSAYGAGLFRPAQSGAASAVSEVVNEWLDDQFQGKEFRELKDRVDQYRTTEPDTWVVTEIRMTAVLCSLSTAAQATKRGYPGFNRHAAAHGASSEYFTQANALRGLMLATGGARELQFWFSNEWQTPSDPKRELGAGP